MFQTLYSITCIKISRIGELQLSTLGCGLHGMAHIQCMAVPRRSERRNMMTPLVNHGRVSDQLVNTDYCYDSLARYSLSCSYRRNSNVMI